MFHGSSKQNWYSILRNGIRVLSKTKYMTAGAAHGVGVYASNNVIYFIIIVCNFFRIFYAQNYGKLL